MTLPDTSSRPGQDPGAPDAPGADAPAGAAPKVDGRPPTVGARPAAAPTSTPVVPPAVEPEVAPAPEPVVDPVPLAPASSAVARARAEAESAPSVEEAPIPPAPVAAEPPAPPEPVAAASAPIVDEPVAAAPPEQAAVEPTEGDGHVIGAADAPGLPVPPCPPFEPAAAPYRWQLRLPGSGASSFTVRVGDDRIQVDGVDVPYDAIVDVDLGIEKDKATVTRRKAANTFLTLSLRDGTVVAGSARDVGRSSGRVESVVAATVYLWAVLGSIPAIRERRGIEEKLRRGAEVTIGHMRITAIGVAWKRNPIATWSSLGDPIIRGTDMVVPTESEPLVVPLEADDAFMLPTLIQELRARFG